MFKRILYSLMITSLVLWDVPLVQALPQNAEVQAGAATFSNPNASTLNVDQTSQNVYIHYDSFDVGATETVNFIQPSDSSVAINKVVGGGGSEILGAINANGRVFVLNGNGILFGEGASINTASFLASTMDVDLGAFNPDTVNPSYTFQNPGSGTIVNQGNITVATDGFAVLMAPQITNTGNIRALKGDIRLAAGNQAVVALDQSGLITFSVDTGTSNPFITNSGLLEADSGSIILEARAAQEVIADVINANGVIKATNIDGTLGQINLIAVNGDMRIGGLINLEGTDILETTAIAGNVNLSASNGDIVLTGEGEIKANHSNYDNWSMPGGKVLMLAYQGEVSLEAGSKIDLSGRSYSHGGLTVDANTINLAGELIGHNGSGGAGKSFNMYGNEIRIGSTDVQDRMRIEGYLSLFSLGNIILQGDISLAKEYSSINLYADTDRNYSVQDGTGSIRYAHPEDRYVIGMEEGTANASIGMTAAEIGASGAIQTNIKSINLTARSGDINVDSLREDETYLYSLYAQNGNASFHSAASKLRVDGINVGGDLHLDSLGELTLYDWGTFIVNGNQNVSHNNGKAVTFYEIQIAKYSKDLVEKQQEGIELIEEIQGVPGLITKIQDKTTEIEQLIYGGSTNATLIRDELSKLSTFLSLSKIIKNGYELLDSQFTLTPQKNQLNVMIDEINQAYTDNQSDSSIESLIWSMNSKVYQYQYVVDAQEALLNDGGPTVLRNNVQGALDELMNYYQNGSSQIDIDNKMYEIGNLKSMLTSSQAAENILNNLIGTELLRGIIQDKYDAMMLLVNSNAQSWEINNARYPLDAYAGTTLSLISGQTLLDNMQGTNDQRVALQEKIEEINSAIANDVVYWEISNKKYILDDLIEEIESMPLVEETPDNQESEPTDEVIEEAPVEEQPGDEVVKETPVEETPDNQENEPTDEVVEETPVEEQPRDEVVKETPVEETPVNQISEEQAANIAFLENVLNRVQEDFSEIRGLSRVELERRERELQNTLFESNNRILELRNSSEIGDTGSRINLLSTQVPVQLQRTVDEIRIVLNQRLLAESEQTRLNVEQISIIEPIFTPIDFVPQFEPVFQPSVLNGPIETFTPSAPVEPFIPGGPIELFVPEAPLETFAPGNPPFAPSDPVQSFLPTNLIPLAGPVENGVVPMLPLGPRLDNPQMPRLMTPTRRDLGTPLENQGLDLPVKTPPVVDVKTLAPSKLEPVTPQGVLPKTSPIPNKMPKKDVLTELKTEPKDRLENVLKPKTEEKLKERSDKDQADKKDLEEKDLTDESIDADDEEVSEDGQVVLKGKNRKINKPNQPLVTF